MTKSWLAFVVSAYFEDTDVIDLTREDAIAAKDDTGPMFGEQVLELNILKQFSVTVALREQDRYICELRYRGLPRRCG